MVCGMKALMMYEKRPILVQIDQQVRPIESVLRQRYCSLLAKEAGRKVGDYLATLTFLSLCHWANNRSETLLRLTSCSGYQTVSCTCSRFS